MCLETPHGRFETTRFWSLPTADSSLVGQPVRFLLVAGRPLKDPVAWYGSHRDERAARLSPIKD